MGELVDFEELIDLNLSLPSVSKESSQEPIADVLDKMCESMGETYFTTNNVFKINENETDDIVPDDDIVNLDAFENLLATSSPCHDENNLVTDDVLEINEKKNDEKVPDVGIVNLDAFENLLATASLCNDESNLVTDDVLEINEKKDDAKVPDDDMVNLDAFENLLATSSPCNDESNLATDDMLEINEKKNDEKVPDDDIVNLDAFENLLATASLCNDETGDMLEINEKKNDLIIPNDDVINLDEFDKLLGAAGLCSKINPITDDISQLNENVVKMPDDAIDLDEFASISANACLFIDDEATTDNSINRVSYAQRVLSYEVPVEFENDCAHTTECDVVKKENVTSTNKYRVNTISLDFTATSNEGEDCIDLDTFEFGTVNQIYNTHKTVKEYENKLETVTEECKMEINFTEGEDIVTLTINDSQVKHENAVIPSETDCKYTIDAVTKNSENKNTDSDDGYDSSDFEFISEQEASKAGIFTRISKITINKTNMDSTTKSTFKNANSVSQHKRNTSGHFNSTSFQPRKNEGSLSEYVKYSKYRYQRCYSRPAAEFHEIPEGERYLDMFRGAYAPEVVNNLYSLTNKRALSAVAMAANFEELAYRDPGREDGINEKYRADAEDCLQKIVSTYRYENRRKRRRH